MTDERLRGLDRLVRADPHNGLSLEKLDRERARAGVPTIKDELAAKLAAVLLERALDAALSWAEWRLEPMPGWVVTDVLCPAPSFRVRELVREVERDAVELTRRIREGRPCALHVEVRLADISYLTSPWEDMVGWPRWFCPAETSTPRGSTFTRGLSGHLFAIRAPAFLGPIDVRLGAFESHASAGPLATWRRLERVS